ncbi:hypothetical protein KC723_03385, partial [Candidatus Kaiserbacteria bacterium]|nr:hypothetical protein [Candidatus Kaiserbacteria bacterium]
MSGVKDSDRLNSVRERLYARGTESDRVVRHGLMEKNKEVAETWEVIKSRQQNPTTDIRKSISSDVERSQPESVVPTAEAIGEEPIENMTKKSKKSYRVIIMLVSIIGFVVVAGLASLFLLFGGNQISGRNIDISLTGPFSASGGEVLPIQVGITNQNSVAIESVVLVVNYPPGTRSADEEPRDLFEERLPLDNIESGEALNVPVRVSLFGEENEEKEINARIEYRLKDSNGRYEKVAEPLKVKIKSSPLVIGIDSVKTVSSGQEIDVTLNVRSNSQVTLKDILVSADYPDSFDFNSSEPSPMYGQNTWLIEEIDPDEEIKIVISGLVIGLVEEESVIKFNAGNPQTDNQFIMGSILAKAETNYTIEKPFIDVGISIGTT